MISDLQRTGINDGRKHVDNSNDCAMTVDLMTSKRTQTKKQRQQQQEEAEEHEDVVATTSSASSSSSSESSPIATAQTGRNPRTT